MLARMFLKLPFSNSLKESSLKQVQKRIEEIDVKQREAHALMGCRFHALWKQTFGRLRPACRHAST